MLDDHLHLWRALDLRGKQPLADEQTDPVVEEVRCRPALPRNEETAPLADHKPHPWARTLRMLPGRRGGRR